MPELLLPSDLTPERAVIWVVSHMEFPDNSNLRLGRFAYHTINRELGSVVDGIETSIPVHWLRAMMACPNEEGMKELVTERNREGTTAGLVLAFLWLMVRGNHLAPSVNKAVHVIEALGAKTKKVDRLYHSDRKRIFAAWHLMRPVAHFWGALVLQDMFSAKELVPPGETAWILFLLNAAALRQFGCGFTAERTKSTVLEASHSLMLPKYIEVEAPPMASVAVPAWMDESLSTYRAPEYWLKNKRKTRSTTSSH